MPENRYESPLCKVNLFCKAICNRLFLGIVEFNQYIRYYRFVCLNIDNYIVLEGI